MFRRNKNSGGNSVDGYYVKEILIALGITALILATAFETLFCIANNEVFFM